LVLYRFFVASNTKQCVSKQCSHLCFLRTGWPDEFVKIVQILAKPIFVKINT
jgi:hypothetical protein